MTVVINQHGRYLQSIERDTIIHAVEKDKTTAKQNRQSKYSIESVIVVKGRKIIKVVV